MLSWTFSLEMIGRLTDSTHWPFLWAVALPMTKSPAVEAGLVGWRLSGAAPMLEFGFEERLKLVIGDVIHADKSISDEEALPAFASHL